MGKFSRLDTVYCAYRYCPRDEHADEDCDAFYASVEELDRPELKYNHCGLSLHRLVPMGVGQGVLTTSNYEARKYGVRSAMPSYIAKKLCPQLILLPLNFEKYTAKGIRIPNACPDSST